MTKPRIRFGLLGAVAMFSFVLVPGQAFASAAIHQAAAGGFQVQKKQSEDKSRTEVSERFHRRLQGGAHAGARRKYEDGIKLSTRSAATSTDVANYLAMPAASSDI